MLALERNVWYMGIMKETFLDIPKGFHVVLRRINLKGGDLVGGPTFMIYHTRSNRGFRLFEPLVLDTVRVLGAHPNQQGIEDAYRIWLADHPLPRRLPPEQRKTRQQLLA
jgi:hypothetical protein